MIDTAAGTTVRLTGLTECGGCAAKWGALGLRGLLDAWDLEAAPDGLLVGTVRDGATHLDLRTVEPSDDERLVAALTALPQP